MKDDRTTAMAGPPTDAAFDQFYFEHCCGRPYKRDDHWLTFFGRIADRIVEGIHPQRVLDAGCAMGLLVETLRARGIEADGVDISSYAIEHVHETSRPFCRVGSIAEEFPARYDLIVSMEVVEHMPGPEAEEAISNFCRHTDDVLFSSSPADYREPTHLNVQPPEYWAEQFARHGFYRDVDFDASFVTAWAVRFRRGRDPLPRVIRDYERRYAELALERNERRQYVLEVQHQVAVELERIAALEHEREAEREALERERRATREASDAERESWRRRCEATDRELASVRTSLEELYGQVTNKVLQLDEATERERGLHRQLFRVSQELEHAHAVVGNMEQSIFWRLRKWLRRP